VVPATTAVAAPAGRYADATNEKGAVTFTVIANGTTVLDFSAQDGYNEPANLKVASAASGHGY
jgi:hypothetical protein